ncbi:MarR family winged helix-turn-helix transcriptional regulator [Roseibium sp. MMSF_3412]|uniref:MarR family winged helix-turn-helix transcriptional regulator n=1 Tax=Roseibium sp. MMSF_3412 TaxID=3046712 RepID=UPI00273ECFD9|nr:MarR family transcriptional regulator [Roseibium sp. MMSF_3412]
MESCKVDEEGLLKIEDQLCFALYSTSRAITREYAVLLETMGVTYPQYLALMVLWQHDGILVQDIAKGLEVDQATATPLVKRLEKLGFVTRRRSETDERRVEVYLTEAGKDLYKTALAVPQGLGCAIGVDQARARKLIDELNDIKAFIAKTNER